MIAFWKIGVAITMTLGSCGPTVVHSHRGSPVPPPHGRVTVDHCVHPGPGHRDHSGGVIVRQVRTTRCAN